MNGQARLDEDARLARLDAWLRSTQLHPEQSCIIRGLLLDGWTLTHLATTMGYNEAERGFQIRVRNALVQLPEDLRPHFDENQN
jgi:hypothetical protein